eukprot:1141325-Pelagomonas_calceolata.AAC.1
MQSHTRMHAYQQPMPFYLSSRMALLVGCVRKLDAGCVRKYNAQAQPPQWRFEDASLNKEA